LWLRTFIAQLAAQSTTVPPKVEPADEEWISGLPSGKLTKAMERSTIFNGKIHYFYGHFQ
jgi:hypothetical protein